ncbi:MAG TPA: outer membrane protein assembly factor BamD [bacterium]|nr:outer membrane protein assembly factor BamD [bacterium]HQG45212.1 outer membrane protein assembly factor BamD [bacterium]HQI48646.1 outer membrane protein assembly factor BamD [bacterium]HQJ66106.1 outer membrane protein assembly factor BamD [bacterium]
MNSATRLSIITLLALGVYALSGCSGAKLRANMTLEERMAAAMQLYQKKDYYEAKNQFRIITLSYSNSNLADKAQFYLGECHYGMKEYILAGSEYERLLKVYPNSEWVDDAKFKLGMSYFKLSPKYSLDQEYTNKAIREFQEFLEEYHRSDLIKQVQEKLDECRNKLAQKVYAAAEQYYKLKYYEAAIVYFNIILDQHYDSRFSPMAQYYLGECYRHIGKTGEALEAYQRLVDKYPDHPLVKKAKQRIPEVQAMAKAMAGAAEKP